MALTLLFEGTVPKHIESPDDNEDARRTALEKGRLLISDGASESFDARNWAQLLVERMLDEEFSLTAVTRCAQDYEALHDLRSLSWSKAAAYERGSFATLLVAQDLPERKAVRVTAVGDSLAAWVNEGELIASSPYTRSEQFQEKPTLLATRLALNTTDDDWNTQEWSYDAKSRRLLLCMTDALGAWLLAHQEQGDSSALGTLCGLRDAQEFSDLIGSERTAGRLRRDDTTLIVVAVTSSSSD